MKKIGIFVLGFVVCFALGVQPAFAATVKDINLSDYIDNNFDWDSYFPEAGNITSASAWAQNYIQQALELELIPESLQGGYQNNITRAEFCSLAVVLYEGFTGEEIAERASFTDTNDVNVLKMGGIGVIQGVGEGKFAPDDLLTREQAALILSNLYEALYQPIAGKSLSFGDVKDISSWAVAGVEKATAAGIMGGMDNNRFSPKTGYTREQSITTMINIYNLVQ